MDPNKDIFNSLCILIAELCEIDIQNIHSNTNFLEIGFDSIKYINMILQLDSINEGFDMETIVTSIDLEEIKTIGDLYDFLLKIVLH